MKRFQSLAEANKPSVELDKTFKESAKTDDNTLLKNFPEEIWLEIATVAHPHDLLNIRESSQYLAHLITPIKFLFALVLKFVLPYTQNDNHVLKNCRQVCRLWCKAVNLVLQEESIHTRIETEKFSFYPQYPKYIQHFQVNFVNQQNMLTKFENQFRETHSEKGRNPFPTRHLQICYSDFDCKNSEYLFYLHKTLKKCGHHIWYLHVWGTVDNPETDFQEMRAILELLPNAKVLTVYQMFPTTKCVPNWYLQPFANMPKLKCVKTYGIQSERLLRALITNNRNVKSMVFFTEQLSDDGSKYDWIYSLQNLERLRVTCSNLYLLQQIGHEQVNWPLKQLVVNLLNTQEPVKWQEMGRYFQILGNKFGDTLEDLQLFFPHVSDLNGDVTLHLPNLTSLHMELTFCISLDFLLPMKNSLKCLNIRVDCSDEQRRFLPALVIQEKTIKFFTLSNPAVDSNIWELFPKLEKLKYWNRFCYHKNHFYTRRNKLTG